MGDGTPSSGAVGIARMSVYRQLHVIRTAAGWLRKPGLRKAARHECGGGQLRGEISTYQSAAFTQSTIILDENAPQSGGNTFASRCS